MALEIRQMRHVLVLALRKSVKPGDT